MRQHLPVLRGLRLDAPTFTSTAGTSVNEEALYSYSITTNDVDGNSLTITAPTKPAWLNLTDNGDGTGTLSGTPTNSEVGTHNVTLRVNDGTVDVDQSFTITVNNVNDAPVLDFSEMISPVVAPRFLTSLTVFLVCRWI